MFGPTVRLQQTIAIDGKIDVTEIEVPETSWETMRASSDATVSQTKDGRWVAVMPTNLRNFVAYVEL